MNRLEWTLRKYFLEKNKSPKRKLALFLRAIEGGCQVLSFAAQISSGFIQFFFFNFEVLKYGFQYWIFTMSLEVVTLSGTRGI